MNIAALKRAVKASADWKGSITGHPNPEVEIEFDLEIAKQRKAVKNAARMWREHGRLLAALRDVMALCPADPDINPAWQQAHANARDLLATLTK